ncbi:MAG: M48 family metalloprotease [Melioribacteraceae bacterium]|nr:M48 family metalloprotease [Melioribacteraceae bacterium]MCF8263876.1 M48 family metalloprotease [Melioribacteraceae bacterium]MCF8412398.1 M48 family metalloprotease [Melioribacteraceae bacterium]
MKLKKRNKIIAGILTLIIIACTGGLNIYSDKDEVAMGQQFAEQIESDNKTYPDYNDPVLEKYIENNIFFPLLASPAIQKRGVYKYDLTLIANDTVLNAFAIPGGNVYLYTGLLKYLDSEAALAGVLGHEIAHAERRHATQRITRAYGLQFLVSIALGNNPSQTTEVVANLFSGLALLANSRSNEDESDEYSIKYMQATKYYPGGVKFFFEKMRDDGLVNSKGQGVGVFLSTHPDPIDRIKTTNERLKALKIPVKSWKSNDQDIYRDAYKNNILSRLK